MTLDEQHDLLILEKLLPTKGTHLSREQYYDLTKDITGNSNDFFKASLLQKGYLQDGHNYIDEQYPKSSDGGYSTVYRIFLTDIGVKAYYDLKKKKRNELIQKVAFWILFAASIVSAWFAGATYFTDDDTKNQKSTTPTFLPKQDQSDTTHKLSQPDRHDTTNPKKTVSSYIDTTKQKLKSNDTTKQ